MSCNSSIAFVDIWLVGARQPICGKIMFSVMSVYHFVHRSLPCDHYPSCIGPDHAGTPRPQLRPLPSSGLFTGTPCPSSPSDMDMFKFLQLGHQCRGTSPHPPDMFRPVHYEVCMVGKWAVRILLECFLVIISERPTMVNRVLSDGSVNFPQGRRRNHPVMNISIKFVRKL